MGILEEMILTNQINVNIPKCYIKPTVILSVGMNDLKSLLPIQDESTIFSSMLSYEKNLNDILNKLINNYNLNVILLSLWEPHCEFYKLYETPRDGFVMILNLWMDKIFNIADKYKIPIIDLTRTLYTYDRSHYGSTIFENSNKSSMFVIHLIEKIFNEFEFKSNDKRSIIYFSSSSFGGIKTEINNMGARIKYIEHIRSFDAFKNIEKQKIKNKNDDDEKNDNDNKNDDNDKNDENVKQVATHIILMGDSVLDNFYWLKNKKKDVKQQILDTYNNNIKVTNLAVDESTSEDVLYGMDPSWTYIDARKQYGLEPYPIDKNNYDKVCPLDIAEKLINENKININVNKNEIKPTVVLSVGGNDVRVLLFNFNLKEIMNGLNKFEINLKEIIEIIINKLKLNLIIVLCYEPYFDFAESYGIKREQLLQIFNIGANKLFNLCNKYNLPIIDLSRTLNPFNRKHYGTTTIEPSNESGQYIVDLIKYINDNYNFNNKKSKIYYGIKQEENGIIEQDNNDDARNGYLAQLLSRTK